VKRIVVSLRSRQMWIVDECFDFVTLVPFPRWPTFVKGAERDGKRG